MNAWTVPGYTETRELGSGGSGRVVLAVHGATGVPVAVKYLSERLRRDPAFVAEFRREARLLGGLRSPYVVGLYEYVEAPDGAAIVMELVDGIALRALLAQEGGTGPEPALAVLKGSLLGLVAAHRAGVVHRDYKPENVLVAADGTSKLVDFGIAAGRGTTPGVAGTPAYMAPEQWRGGPASPAADVYAATAVFFECLTGRKPFAGENFAELALQHIEAPVPADAAPEPVRPLILRGLAKSPRDRPENAEVFVAELEGVARHAYGPDWEERGQRRLAALAALLPLLFPSAQGGAAAGTTSLAETELASGPTDGTDPGGWWPGRRGLFAAGAAAVAGAVLVLATQAAGGEPGGRAAVSSFATTSAGPGPSPTGTATGPVPSASPTPEAPYPTGPTPTPTGSPDPGPSWTPSPTPSWTPSPSPSWTPSWSATPTPTRSVTRPPVSPPPTTEPPVPEPRVRSVEVSGFRQTGVTTGEAVVTVTREAADSRRSSRAGTGAAGAVTVTLEWFTSDESGGPGSPEGSESHPYGEGPLTVSHSFSGNGCYWSVRATTRPAAGNGSSVQQLFVRRCTIS